MSNILRVRQTRFPIAPIRAFFYSIVLDVGPSLRNPPARKPQATGTRIRQGNHSRYRFEGNRIDFDQLTNRQKRLLTRYRSLIESVPNSRPLSAFNRDEQLAYWLNLHNVVLLEQMALHHPFKRPRNLRVTDIYGERQRLFDAKLVTVQGVPLSLNDIRVNIVYRHWLNEPVVMYGFSYGEVGGPSIAPRAFNGANVRQYLDRNATEYVNSLRGVDKFGRGFSVSQIYADHREIFFPNWPSDLLNHLRSYADDPVLELLSETNRIRFSKYDPTVIDLSGGGDIVAKMPDAPDVQKTTIEATSPGLNGAPGSDGVTSGVTVRRQSLQELELRSRIELRRRRIPEAFWPGPERRRGSVTITDVTAPEDTAQPEKRITAWCKCCFIAVRFFARRPAEFLRLAIFVSFNAAAQRAGKRFEALSIRRRRADARAAEFLSDLRLA